MARFIGSEVSAMAEVLVGSLHNVHVRWLELSLWTVRTWPNSAGIEGVVAWARAFVFSEHVVISETTEGCGRGWDGHFHSWSSMDFSFNESAAGELVG